MNINNKKQRPKSFVNFIGGVIATKEMNVGTPMWDMLGLKQMNPD